MPPELADLLAVTAEIGGDLDAMALQAGRVRDSLRLDTWDGPRLAPVAVAIDRWYAALERALERVLKLVDGRLPQGARWHRAVLERACLDIPGLRPPIVPPGALANLGELLGFRHVFHHAHTVDFEEPKLRVLAERLVGIDGDVRRAIGELLVAQREAAVGG